MDSLFGSPPGKEFIGDGAYLLRGFVGQRDEELLVAIDGISAVAPFRHLETPRGFVMSVAMTNCGQFGWHSDRKGYRYVMNDPLSGKPWPAIPKCFMDLAVAAAAEAGYEDFQPDACLINRYEVGAKLSLHQDKDEKDLAAPIVSVSLGIPAVFQFGGLERSGPMRVERLEHGDVVVWGGPSRLNYHGIKPLKPAVHEKLGALRMNLTFRKTA